MHDAGELRAVQRAAGVQGQQHRGAGLLLLAEEAVLVGQRQMHPGIVDAIRFPNGPAVLPSGHTLGPPVPDTYTAAKAPLGVPLIWDHLIYAYLIESTGALGFATLATPERWLPTVLKRFQV